MAGRWQAAFSQYLPSEIGKDADWQGRLIPAMLRKVNRVKIKYKIVIYFSFMLNSNQPEQELLKTILEPLLEDFQYWFSRARDLLESEKIPFLESERQADLLSRVKQAQQEVSTAQMLFQATGGQVGLETATLMPWHQLVTECWQVAMRYAREQSTTSRK